MVFSSLLLSFFFFGSTTVVGWLIQILFFSYLIVLIRATFPRYKYNDLMNLGWKVFLPLSLSFLLFVVFIIFFYNCQLLG
jgi:NADH:ubiquinone oxidoreductase subunit H